MPQPLTKQERLIAALERRGGRRIKELKDCLVFSDPEAGKFAHIPQDSKYYIGPKGSIRRGRNRNSAHPMNERIKAQWLAEPEGTN